MNAFEINFLDHVALRVKNVEVATSWYAEVLGLKIHRLHQAGHYPVFMSSGKFGIYFFPANLQDPELDATSKHVKIDHFAFNVSRSNFKKAEQHYIKLGLDYNIQDHKSFHSMYTKDPDGHTVELTTLVVDESLFY